MRKLFQQSNSETYGVTTDVHVITGDLIITMSIKVEHDQKQMKGKAKIQVEDTNLIQVKTKRW